MIKSLNNYTMTKSKSNFNKVRDFNTCFGHKVSDNKYLDIFEKDIKLVELRYNLIEEEVEELNVAFNTNDIVEIIDALSDILYVVYGFGVVFGIDIDSSFKKYCGYKIECFKENDMFQVSDEVLKQNEINDSMTNFQMVKKIYTILRSTCETESLIDFNAKDYMTNIKNMLYLENIKTKIDNLNQQLVTLKELIKISLSIDDKEKLFKKLDESICDITYTTYIIGAYIGVDLDHSFDIVHNSNMSKICSTEDEAKQTVEWYLKNEQRYKTPNYRTSDFGYTIFNEDSGKILKSINYKKASFTELL